MYPIDTNVVSELRRASPRGAVVNWIEEIPAEQVFLSAVTVGEIQAGMETTRNQGPAKARELELWLAKVVDNFGGLPMDSAAFRT